MNSRRSAGILALFLLGWTVGVLPACCHAGQMGSWTIQSKARAQVHTWPRFSPVLIPTLHLFSEASATATAHSPQFKAIFPYEISWWQYVTAQPYDDFTLYRAIDTQGTPTDLVLLLRESRSKLPASPEEWKGVLWIEDKTGLHSVAPLLRPGWRRFALRRSAQEVELLIDGAILGRFSALGTNPAAILEVGESNTHDGAGEAYWTDFRVTTGGIQTALDFQLWKLLQTGAGKAEIGTDFESVQQVNLYLHLPGQPFSRAEAEWGTVTVEAPYQAWFHLFISEKPYRNFIVVSPLDAERKPTDVTIEFDDPSSETGIGNGYLWITDGNGRQQMTAAPARGVWHEVIIRRRKVQALDVLIDGQLIGSFSPRSTQPVASFIFGKGEGVTCRGEAYWNLIRLVRIPKN